MIDNLRKEVAYEELKVNPAFYRHIIRKNGINNCDSDVIRIEGSPEGVGQVEKELLELVHRMEDEISKNITIEKGFHHDVIGTKGEKIKGISDKFNQKNTAELRMDIDPKHHRYFVTKGVDILNHISDDYGGIAVSFPRNGSNSCKVVLKGDKDFIEGASYRLQEIVEDLEDMHKEELLIDSEVHCHIIGSGGRKLLKLMDMFKVDICFPRPSDPNPDLVVIQGAEDDVMEAKNHLLQLEEKYLFRNFELTVEVDPQYHSKIIGRNGAVISKIRKLHNVQTKFPERDSANDRVITIIGHEKDAEAAKEAILKLVEEQEDMHKEELLIYSEVHAHIIGSGGRNLFKIMDMFKVEICFSRSSDPNPDLVVIQGAEDDVLEAKNHLLQLEEKYLLRNFELTVEVDPQYYSKIIGRNGAVISKIRKEHNVQTKFPERDSANDRVITIIGHEKDAVAAKEAILKLVQEQDNVQIIEEMEVPYNLHRFIIGHKGTEIENMKELYDVMIFIPPIEEKSDVITIKGPPENVAKVKESLKEKIKEIQDDLSRSFRLTVEVDPQYHPKIIGYNGTVISKIRNNHNVQIRFPKRDSVNDRVITIIGHKKDAEAAKEAILKLIQEREKLYKEHVSIDSRLHSRIIGNGSHNLLKIMNLFKVDIRFPRPSDPDPDLVVIQGSEDDVLAAKDYILNLEGKYTKIKNPEYFFK